jgi:threonine dehydratase
LIELKRIQEAQVRIRPFVHRTPIYGSKYLSAQTGCEVLLKAESLQKTGSFKPRGAINKLKSLSAAEKARGIVTVSAGNHAQAAAFAAAMENLRCWVVMPTSAPQIKLDATRGYGATVVLHEDRRTLFERCEELRVETGATFLHPFDDEDVIAGQATVGLEILEDVPDVDAIIVGIGGGGLISGVATAVKQKNPSVRVFGVEPEGAPAMKLALQAGKPVKLEKLETVADGLAAPYAGTLNLEIVQQNVDDVVLIPDAPIIESLKILLERSKLLVEPAGAASVAALLSGKINLTGKKVVAILSGGNLDIGRLGSWL